MGNRHKVESFTCARCRVAYDRVASPSGKKKRKTQHLCQKCATRYVKLKQSKSFSDTVDANDFLSD